MIISPQDQVFIIPSAGWIHLGFVTLLIFVLVRKKITFSLASSCLMTGLVVLMCERSVLHQILQPAIISIWFQLAVFSLLFVILVNVLPPQLIDILPKHLNKRKDYRKIKSFSPEVGQTLILPVPIVNGCATLDIENNTWIIRGPDAILGTRIKVVGVDGKEMTIQLIKDE